MTRKIIDTGAAYPRVRDVSPALPRVDPAAVAEALGAEATDVTRGRGGGPLSVFLLRAELEQRLRSSGGRPALEGASQRVKVPIAEQEWRQLEALAAAISDARFTPSAGQVASVLLSLSLRSITEGDPQRIRKELQERASVEAGSTP